MKNHNAYVNAQAAIAKLKGSIYELLDIAPDTGYTNAEIGRALGIYTGYAGHEGHISRTLLGIMEAEGVVTQDPETKKWRLSKLETREV